MTSFPFLPGGLTPVIAVYQVSADHSTEPITSRVNTTLTAWINSYAFDTLTIKNTNCTSVTINDISFVNITYPSDFSDVCYILPSLYYLAAIADIEFI